MIHIASVAFDLLGYISFNPLNESGDAVFSRRISKSRALNGSVVVSDLGYTDGDLTLVYRYKPISKEHDDRAKRIVSLHEFVTVSTKDGVYKAAPSEFEPGEENQITLEIVEKLSEG
jgi:hypothetical protein